jgi:hypothetical protein
MTTRQSAAELVKAMRPLSASEARQIAGVVAAAAKRIETGSEETDAA